MRFLAFCFLTTVLFSCQKKEINSYQLSHDGENFDAPLLDSGTFLVTARYLASEFDLSDNLTKVGVYTKEVPVSSTIEVYGSMQDLENGNTLSALLVNCRAEHWNLYDLEPAVNLNGLDTLYIAFRFTNNEKLQVIGCDQGPTKEGGDLILPYQSTQFTTFTAYRPGNSINWNIRGFAE